MKRFLSLAFIVIFYIPCLFAGTRDPYTPDEKYLEYGSKFHNVVLIHGLDNNNNIFFASAVIINDHHILTAAHVVHNAKECFVILDKKNFKLIEIICHKNFDNKEFPSGDIAIGYCDKQFGLDFYPSLYDGKDEINKVSSISGFGLTGTFRTGAIVSDSKRRAGSNHIDKIEGDLLICSPTIGPKKTSLEFLIASGDSGGGLFIDGKLAGINSFIMCAKGLKLNSDYFTESGHTRISDYIDWIKENTKE